MGLAVVFLPVRDDSLTPVLLTDDMAVITVGFSGLKAHAATQSGLLSG